jgi:hypothetical protein
MEDPDVGEQDIRYRSTGEVHIERAFEAYSVLTSQNATMQPMMMKCGRLHEIRAVRQNIKCGTHMTTPQSETLGTLRDNHVSISIHLPRWQGCGPLLPEPLSARVQ